MPADPPRPARDEVVERLEHWSEDDFSSAFALRRDDIRTILARLAQAEIRAAQDTAALAQEIEHLRADAHAATVRAEEAERLAGERLEAAQRLSAELMRFQEGERASAIHVREVIERHCGNHTAAHQAANALRKEFTLNRRAAALADAQGGRGAR